MEKYFDKLNNRSKNFPDNPGVYLFYGAKNKVLYVGRATSLKKRIANYFRKNIDPRIEEMVSLAKKLEFRKTRNLLEAIILEANLIKKYWPKYNIKDKDDRSYIYIVFPKTEFSHPILVRERELKKFYSREKTFGPYQNQYLIQKALKIIRRIFPYSTCVPKSGKACFDYQIGLCPGACVEKITKQEYQNNIKNIILLLSGKNKQLIKKLKVENPDKILALKHLEDTSLIHNSELNTFNTNVESVKIEGYDISHFAGKETYGSMVVFIDNIPDKKLYRLFKIKNTSVSDDLGALREIILRRLKHKEWLYPNFILLDGGKPQVNFVYKLLVSQNINIPLIGISKFAGDKLVFSPKISNNMKEILNNQKPIFLKVRNEAHRFANKSSRRARNIKR